MSKGQIDANNISDWIKMISAPVGEHFNLIATSRYTTKCYTIKYDNWHPFALSTIIVTKIITSVSFTAVKCKPYDPPINGLIACSYSQIFSGESCTPQCTSTKEFARIPAQFYICQTVGTWYVWDIRPTVSQEMPWPDCTGTLPVSNINIQELGPNS